MSNCIVQGDSHNGESYFDKARETLEFINPRRADASPIFSVQKFGDFLYGSSYSEQKAAKDLFYDDVVSFSPQYSNTFSTVIARMLRQEGMNEVVSTFKAENKEISINNVPRKVENLSEKEVIAYIAELFKSSASSYAGGEVYTTTSESLDDLFQFLNSFYATLEDNKSALSGAVVGSASVDTGYELSDEGNGKFKVKGISTRTRTYLNQGMNVILPDLLSAKQISTILSSPEDSKEIMNNIYGTPSDMDGKVLGRLKAYLAARYNTKIDQYEESEEGSPKEAALLREIQDLNLLKNTDGFLELEWDSVVKGHVAHLASLGLYVNLDQSEDTATDNASDEEASTRDSLGITPAHEVNPASRLSSEIKFLISTLPIITGTKPSGEYQFKLNKLGVPENSNPSDITSRLYKELANTSSPEMMMEAMKKLGEENPVFNILLERMGLKFANWEFADELDSDQMKVMVGFLTAFNNAKPLYQITQVTGAGQRSTNDANTENNERLVKYLWKENFTNVSQSSLGKVSGGRMVLDLSRNIDGFTIREMLEHGGNGVAETLQRLSWLGIEFSNVPAVTAILESPEGAAYNSDIDWLLGAVLLADGDVHSLFNLNVGGNLKNLIGLQLATSSDIGSMQFRGVDDGKIYAVSLKGFLNVLVDDLNQGGELLDSISKSPTAGNSVWAQWLREGKQMKVAVITGTVNTETQRSVGVSKQSPSDIAVQMVSNILSGFVPTIKEGNKKTHTAINIGGKPTFKTTREEMVDRLRGYLEDEILTASMIRFGAAQQIKGVSTRGREVQFFAHDDFSEIKDLIERLVSTRGISREGIQAGLDDDVTEALEKHLEAEILRTKAGLIKYNVVQENLNNKDAIISYTNVGVDNNHLDSLNKTLVTNGKLDDLNIYPSLFDKLAEQLTIERVTSTHEQFKILFGHPANFSDIFKRVSLFISPKIYPATDTYILDWAEKSYKGRGNPNRYKLHNANEVRFITRKEVTEVSAYTYQYIETLKALKANEALIGIVEDTYGKYEEGKTGIPGQYSHGEKGMEVFDGGGMIHLDFYRRVRLLTDSWGKTEEAAYHAVINGTASTADVGILSPIKPQVIAQALEDGIDFRVGNKFALFPIHPNLSKVLDGNTNTTVLDALYEDMNTNNLDYVVSESTTKIGAKMNSQLKFDDYISEDGSYAPLQDTTAVQSYPLQYFGVQMAPKDKRGSEVPVGTQSMAMMLNNIFDGINEETGTSILNEKYKAMPFSSEESWEEAGDRYHRLHGELIERETQVLAIKLGYQYSPSDKTFLLLDKQLSRELMRDTILDEMSRREISDTMKETILTVFDGDMNLMNQSFEKSRLETIVTSIITSSIVRRKMRGEMVVLQSNFGLQIDNKAMKQSNASAEIQALRKLKAYRKDISDSDLQKMSPEARAEFLRTADTLAMEVYMPHAFKEFYGEDIPEYIKLTDEVREAIGFRIPTEGYNSIEYIKIVDFLPVGMGSTIIVPSEIVAKSGADFDIDKLTLYLPNVELVGDTLQPMRRIDPSTATVEDVEYLRKTDLDNYKSLFFKTFPTNKALEHIKDLTEIYSSKSAVESLFKDYAQVPEVKAFKEKLKEKKETASNIINPVDKAAAYRAIDKLRDDFLDRAISAPHTIFEGGSMSNARMFQLDIMERLAEKDRLLHDRFFKLTSKDVQTKKYMQNQVQNIMRDILKHPLSFDQLITPVGAFTLKDIAYKIDKLVNKEDWVGDERVKKDLVDMLSLDNLISTEFIMNQTIGGTGIVASSSTHVAKLQRVNMAFNKDAGVVFNFSEVDPSYSISKTYTYRSDVTINSLMQQYISGYVDGEKDPFVTYVNAGKEGAPVHMALETIGLPLETALAFMSQPILFEYFALKNENQSQAAMSLPYGVEAYKSDKDIIASLITKYGGVGGSVQLSEELLAPYIGKDLLVTEENSDNDVVETFGDIAREIQVQVLQDFIRYKEYARHLKNLEVTHSYDKLKLKNESESIYLEALERKVRVDGIFTGIGALTSSKNSMLSYGRNAIKSSTKLLESVDLKNTSTALREVFIGKAYDMIESGLSRDDITYTLNRFDNFITANLIQSATYGEETISDMRARLFQGPNSLPRRIDALQKSGEVQNLVIDSLLPLLDPYIMGTTMATVDGLKLHRGKYDIGMVDILKESFEDLRLLAPDIHQDLVIFSVLQSGVDYSQNSFAAIIPPADVAAITKNVFDGFLNSSDVGGKAKRLWHSFLDNNWHNSVISHQVYVGDSKSAIFHADEIKADANAFPWVKKNSLTLSRKVGEVYSYSHFTRNRKGDDWLRAGKMGVKGKLLEAVGSTSIILTNAIESPLGLLTNNVDLSRKILKGTKNMHYSSSRVANGLYSLGNQALIDVKYASRGNSSEVIKSGSLGKSPTGARWDKATLAKALGFSSLAQANKTPDLKAFFADKSPLFISKLDVQAPGNTGFVQESSEYKKAMEAETAPPSQDLSNLTEQLKCK